MSLKCGIVGLPNAGKSSLFNALVDAAAAETGNYPFCTIDANRGRALVPDERLKKISRLIQPARTVPASFEFADIAGLIKGASKGEGLGNQFLSHIREADSLLHLVRAFEDGQISHAYGGPDPARDVEIVNTELLLSDMETAEKRLQKIQKTAQASGGKKLKWECAALEKAIAVLSSGKSLREGEWTEEERGFLKSMRFISSKPVLYVCNLKEGDFAARGASQSSKARETAAMLKQSLGGREETLCVSAALEADMAGLPEEEKAEFLKPLGLKEPALRSVIRKVYGQLGLISFFTAGEKEVKAWTVPKGAAAPQAAGRIHSDFERGFIRAEIYACEALFRHKSEKALKSAGLLRSEGKDYIVQDGDVARFLFSGAKSS